MSEGHEYPERDRRKHDRRTHGEHQHRIHLHRRNARRLGFAYYLNISAGMLWLVMIPVALTTSLEHSVPFLVGISLYALFAAHLSAAFAAAAGKGANEAALTLHSPDVPPGP
jgi:hypothetical protein